MNDLVFSIVNDAYQFKPFNCGDEDLNEFLFFNSKNYRKEFLATTYVIENKDETIAYFSLFNDSLKVENIQSSKNAVKTFLRRILPHSKRHLKNYPAVKIGRLAVSIKKPG